MVLYSLAFLLGNYYLQTFKNLPSGWLLVVFILSAMILCLNYILYNRKRKLYLDILLIGFISGFVYTFWFALKTSSWHLEKELENKPLQVIGQIKSIPHQNKFQTSFLFYCDQIINEKKYFNVQHMIRLSCLDHCNMHFDETWQFTVKLKNIHSLRNLGTYDYEAYSFSRDIRAVGKIITNKPRHLISNSHFSIGYMREKFVSKINNLLKESAIKHWIIALCVGEKFNIPANDWEILRHTGTNHLMAIAGLHIGILSGLMHKLTQIIWRLFPIFMLVIPTKIACASFALICAITYSALAGFSIPTQRATLMLCVFIISFLCRRKINPWHSFSLSLLIVLLLNPMNTLNESFWLSFGTIALIIYGMSGRVAPKGIWWQWGRVQWLIAVGILPLSIYFYNEVSFISFIANTIAIPWLGLAVLPFCFIGTLLLLFSDGLSEYLLVIAEKSLYLLWQILSYLSQWHLNKVNGFFASDAVSLFCMMIAVIFFFLPKGMPGKAFSLVWLLPVIFSSPNVPATNEYHVSVLDIGQGLAIVVRTHEHTLIFDTGPKRFDGPDMGAEVVIPYLKKSHISKIDLIVVSHGDNDHSGGLEAVLKELNVAEIKTSVPKKFLGLKNKVNNISYCLMNESWQWDGVKFQFLYPNKVNLNLGNDSSCVLLIDNSKHRTLLTGDIEKHAEKVLIKKHADKIDILVAPHHGSKTSIYLPFINKIAPNYVVYSVGYRNRYHFPHPTVVKLYEYLQSLQLSTSLAGTVNFMVYDRIQVTSYRKLADKYWHDSCP